MSDASIWKPGNDTPLITAANTQLFEHFTATAAQTVFSLSVFTYVVTSGSLRVTVNGVMQTPVIDFTETSTSSFTLVTAADAGDDVVAWGLTESTIGTYGGVAVETHAAAAKITPVDADEFPLVDSAAGYLLKKVTWANIKATAKTYFDTLYAAIGANSNITSLSGLSGNIAFTGTGNRITGDFSNATSANRVVFQTSTTNGQTLIPVIPNGTNTSSGIQIHNASDIANSATGYININGANFAIQSAITGTGTYLPMTFYTGGSERMRIDSSGNVGVGISPASGFRVDSFGGYFRHRNNVAINAAASDGTNSLMLQSDGSTGQCAIIAAGNSFLTFHTSAAATPVERMRIDTSGNVGIGTGGGSATTLDQVGSVRPFTFQGASTSTTVGDGSGGAVIVNASTTTNNLSSLAFASITGANSNYYASALIQVQHGARTNGQYHSGSIIFSTSVGSNVAPLERMRIDSSGNVGIGCTPASTLRLHVKGSDTTASNYAAAFQDSGGNNIAAFRNDKQTAFYGETVVIQPAGLGYGTGAGGTVTQATSKATAVTLNKPTGQITMNNAALASGASVTFALSNSLVTVNDAIIANHGGTGTSAGYAVQAIQAGGGAANIRVTNITAGSLSEAITINFAIIKGATS